MARRVLVGVKRVVDYTVKTRLQADKKAIELANIKMSMNPFCEIAVEQAIRLKEAGIASETIALSIGPKKCQETIRQGLAMGIDRAIHIETDMRPDLDLQPLAVAKLFAKICEEEKIDIAIVGKQSIDDDCNQTGQMLAGLLDWPQATFASEMSFNDDHSAIDVTRETDAGLQTVSVSLPAVITADLRLNDPRFAKLPNIMKAKKKKIDVRPIDDMGVDVDPRITINGVREPAARDAGVMVESVDELVEKLREKGLV